MYIHRTLERELLKYLDRREILAITGPRQSGKTTLLRHLHEGLEGAAFLDFEDRRTLELFTGDLQSFIDLHVKGNKYLFIDEFQYAPDGGKSLKFIYDHHPIKMVVSGSSASGLSIQGARHLVGRIFVFTLFPFSFEEFLGHREAPLLKLMASGRGLSAPVVKRILPYFHEFCLYGGYPRVVLADDREEKEIVLRNIYSTYFLKEVREILRLPEDYKLSRLIHALALQAGSILNYNELGSISGFSHPELKRHLNILEKTFICQQYRPFFTNKRTELAKAPKVFFMDAGFRNAVIGDFQPLGDRADKGALYENFVASELMKGGIEPKYWRTKSKAEVDFVVESRGSLVPIEVKSGLRRPQTTKSFQSFLGKYRPKKAIVLSESLYADERRILFRPIFSVAGEICPRPARPASG